MISCLAGCASSKVKKSRSHKSQDQYLYYETVALAPITASIDVSYPSFGIIFREETKCAAGHLSRRASVRSSLSRRVFLWSGVWLFRWAQSNNTTHVLLCIVCEVRRDSPAREWGAAWGPRPRSQCLGFGAELTPSHYLNQGRLGCVIQPLPGGISLFMLSLSDGQERFTGEINRHYNERSFPPPGMFAFCTSTSITGRRAHHGTQTFCPIARAQLGKTCTQVTDSWRRKQLRFSNKCIPKIDLAATTHKLSSKLTSL